MQLTLYLAVIVALTLASNTGDAFRKARRMKYDRLAHASLLTQSKIVGGKDASVAEFPWQLSQQRRTSSGTWSHSCGATLLSPRYVLSAAHCVDGSSASDLRVVAGLQDRTESFKRVISNVKSYKKHEHYKVGPGTLANDIAILTLSSLIHSNGYTIQYASLPDGNVEQFVGRTCVLSGWGRTGTSGSLPVHLQKVDMEIISTEECVELMASVIGAVVTENMICLHDPATKLGSCTGDSGGPLTCNYPDKHDARRVVYGVTSWGILKNNYVCMQVYPSVYTRVGAYLAWIKENTPENLNHSHSDTLGTI